MKQSPFRRRALCFRGADIYDRFWETGALIDCDVEINSLWPFVEVTLGAIVCL